MFPTSAAKLPLVQIADYWSRDDPRASRDELLASLESAWWRGELRGNSWDSRLQLLKKMFEKRREPELQSVAFVSPNDAGPPTEIPLPDGGVAVIRRIISVPDATEDWTEASCSDAFEALANLPSQEYFPLFSYSICFIDLTYEEFCSWTASQKFRAPGFWLSIAANRGKVNPATDKSVAKRTQGPAEVPPKLSKADASRIYAKYRCESKPITDRDADTAYMKQFGVGREWVREERRKFPSRKRGERKSAKSADEIGR